MLFHMPFYVLQLNEIRGQITLYWFRGHLDTVDRLDLTRLFFQELNLNGYFETF